MNRSSLKPRVVVLGAAGFIGFHLAKAFVNQGNHVIAVDNLVRGKTDKEFRELIADTDVTYLEMDLAIEANYLNLFQPGDLVFNCAALNGTQNFYSNPFRVIQNSAIPAIHAVKFAALAKVERYIYFGSSESYAGGLSLGLIEIPTPENVPLTVPDVTEVRWSYAASKTIGEVAAFAAQKEFGLEIQILRIHNIYGPRMGDKHVIPDLVGKFRTGDMSVHGAGETRSFFYIDDLVDVLVKLSGMIHVPEVLNIGSDREIEIQELAGLIAQEMDLESRIIPVEPFPGSVTRRCPNVHLLKSLIDYDETSLEVGIARTVKWYLESV